MKKFMLFVLIAMLSGCATTVPAEDREEINPHHSNAKKIGAFATGAIVANAVARKTGAGQAMSYAVGLLGGIVGVNLVKGDEWKPGDDEIVYIDQPAGYYPQSGYSSCGAVNVVCNQRRVPYGLYGYCDDEDSGGYATQEDLVRRAEQRAGCYRNAQPRYRETQHVVHHQPQQQVVFPSSLWKRPENRHQKDSKEGQARLTVENYTRAGALPVGCNCQTGNWAVDSIQIRNVAKKLEDLQVACKNGAKNSDCYRNPGILSREYYDLAASLDAHQEDGEKRRFVRK